MQSETDAKLLHEYADSGSEEAFGELVRRHADLVYSAALRQVGDPEAARDVTQNVFGDLARKARSLRGGVLLVGWLYRGTRYAALNELRSERRRQQRERLAMELLQPADESAIEWERIRAVIDEAMTSLNDQDRDAVLLRFFKNQNLATIGAALGISEDAAQKRVTRALDKLREFLSRRGVKSAVGGLAAAISANAVQSAPAGLAAAVTAGALAAGKVASSAFGLAQFVPSLKTAATIGLVVAVAGLGTLHLKLREELRDARATVERLSAELQQLRAENQRLAALRTDPAELERLRQQAEDVHRLRAETGRLRRELDEARTKALATFQPATTNAALETAAKPPPQVTLESKFVEVPDSVLRKIGAGWLVSGTAPVNGVFTDEQFQQFLKALEHRDGVDVLSAPRVTTLNERQAGVSTMESVTVITDPVTLATRDENVGCSVDVIPYVSADTSSLELAVLAEQRNLYQTTTPEGRPAQEVRPLKIMARGHLFDGQTFVLREAWTNADKRVRRSATNSKEQSDPGPYRDEVPGPRSLLVLITATLVDAAGNAVHATKP